MRRVSDARSRSGRAGAVGLAFFACLALAACDVEQKPTRSECITGFRMDWSGVRTPREDVIHAMFDARPVGAAKKPMGLDPLVSMTVPWRNRHELYLQFSRECKKKWEMFDRLIAIWRAAGLDLPKFERMPEPIVPSPDAIDLRSPSWRD